jgi:hypothetical protein
VLPLDDNRLPRMPELNCVHEAKSSDPESSEVRCNTLVRPGPQHVPCHASTHTRERARW